MLFFLYVFVWMLVPVVADEVSSHAIPCNNTDDRIFHCKDGTCITREHFCDDEDTCLDGSDEIPYDNTTGTDVIRCQYRPLLTYILTEKECALPARYKCDHELDCVGGLDECDCDHTFRCDNGECALKVSFCDNLPSNKGCRDGTDERVFNRTTKEGFQCPVTRTHVKKVCVLPDRYVCDGDSDCDFGIDECFCDFSSGDRKGIPLNDVYSSDKCFRCLDGSLIIPNIHVCDGVLHCEDLSDECLCPEINGEKRMEICDSICLGDDCECTGQIQCVSRQRIRDVITPNDITTFNNTEKICVEPTSICDGAFDCANEMDEDFCPLDDQYFECYDGTKKIYFYELCDGPSDCDDESDEIYCDDIMDHYCTDYRHFFGHVTDWKNVTEEDNVAIKPGWRAPFDHPFVAKACDGIPLCTFLDDECNNGCPIEPGYCEHVSEGFKCPNSDSVISGIEICDEKPTCNDIAPHLSADEFHCPSRFYCDDRGENRLPIHIPLKGRCNGKQECDDSSDELNCSESTHFYCKDDGSTLFVPISQKCDGRKDCKGGLDECQQCNPSPFSSDEALISSRVLIVFLWTIGIFAVIGNSGSVIHQMNSLFNSPRKLSRVAFSNRLLVLNLALSDLLVGIYLVALGIKDSTVSEYCLLDQEWRSGRTCSVLGAIALVGIESSVFILVIMTALRLYLILRPFASQDKLFIGPVIIFAWGLSFALAFVPFADSVKDYFVSCVWFRTHHFVGRICKKDLQDFTSDFVTLEGNNSMFSKNVETGYSWDNMFNAMKELNSTYVPERYFGYYSAHSVCLPRLFPDPTMNESYGYTLFIILINLFALVFILISYLIIYKTTTGQGLRKSNSDDRASTLQRKVTRIVLTDFCCWMPVCVMNFVKFSGVEIPDVAYAVTAIIILPINSAMNPFLYTDILDIIWKKMAPVRALLERHTGLDFSGTDSTAAARNLAKRSTISQSTQLTIINPADTTQSPAQVPLKNAQGKIITGKSAVYLPNASAAENKAFVADDNQINQKA